MSWRSESPFTVGFRAYVGFWFHCSPNPFLAAGLLGPGQPHPRLAERLGSHALLMEAGWTIVDHVPGEHEHTMIGVHGGLSADEMRVPLILART